MWVEVICVRLKTLSQSGLLHFLLLTVDCIGLWDPEGQRSHKMARSRYLIHYVEESCMDCYICKNQNQKRKQKPLLWYAWEVWDLFSVTAGVRLSNKHIHTLCSFFSTLPLLRSALLKLSNFPPSGIIWVSFNVGTIMLQNPQFTLKFHQWF